MPGKTWVYVYRCRRCRGELRTLAGKRSLAVNGLIAAQDGLIAGTIGPAGWPPRPYCIHRDCADDDGFKAVGWADLIGTETLEES